MSIFINEEDNKKETERVLKQSFVEGTYISLNLGEQEKTMRIALKLYNELCDKNMPEILRWNHIDLYNACPNKVLSISDWKHFIMDSRVQAWVNDEIRIMMRTKTITLLDKVGDNNSTATVQALTALMKADKEDDNKIDDGKIFIYTFMPLTAEERRLNNAQVLRTVPNELKDALQYVSPDGDN